MKNIVEAWKEFQNEGNLFGYSNSILIFLKNYFIDRIYRE